MAHSDAQLTVADYRLDAAERFADQLGERAEAIFVDAEDESSPVEAMEGADAAIASCPK